MDKNTLYKYRLFLKEGNMSVQGISPLNGIVANPYGQGQVAALNPIGIDPNNVANNAILTGNVPLASAVNPAQQQAAQQVAALQTATAPAPVQVQAPIQQQASQQLATSQAAATPAPVTAPQPQLQLAKNPPAPDGCAQKLDCVA